MMKPELSKERIEAVRERAEHCRKSFAVRETASFGPHEFEDRDAETTLALIESHKQALELLRRIDDGRKTYVVETHGEDGAILFDEIAAFLEQNQ